MIQERGVTLLKRITVNDWRILSEEDRTKYEFVSDSEGCYFRLIEVKEEPKEDETDDFEKIMKERKQNG